MALYTKSEPGLAELPLIADAMVVAGLPHGADLVAMARIEIIYIIILSDMENLLSVWENVLSIASVTKSGEYYIKKRESATSSKIFINSNTII